jgi:cytochrome c553
MMSMFRFSTCLLVAALALNGSMTQAEDVSTRDIFGEVLPLLKTRCVPCHGPAKQEGKLNLALPSGIKRGGKNGDSVAPGDLEHSLLWRRVAADEMPEDAPLPPEEKALLKRWIEAGAPGLPEKVSAQPNGDEHWAFQKLAKVPVPKLKDEAKVRTPVDRFIQSRLEAVGLMLGTDASRETLIRRVSLDLTGLPPAPADIDSFLKDTSAQAYESMVERYLSSRQYGERWGKYWLDTAGYADSNGYFGADTDRPLAYRYRDYVIRSINADKPWDQFIREQLAGDELAGYRAGGDVSPAMVELLEAVHFLRNSPDGTDGSDGNPDELRADKYAVLEGTVQIIGSSLLGLTVQCARCHDHKFEPFSQRDYYQLQATIYPAFNVEQWIKPKDRVISTATAAELAARDAQIKQLDAQIAEHRRQYAEWVKQNRQRGQDIFFDDFDDSKRMLAESWTNTVPGEDKPAGVPGVQLDSPKAPAAQAEKGSLQIIESGAAGDRVLSTRKKFDWTPDVEKGWVQATFDLMDGGATAPYVGFLIALHDFNDAKNLTGGNILLDGATTGQATVYVDYPGSDAVGRGKIGKSGFAPGRNYGVRITNVGNGKFELAQVVDGIIEENTVTLTTADLPDGSFGFEYCCSRSFVVDNVLIEYSPATNEKDADKKALAELHEQKRQAFMGAVKALETQRPAQIGRLAAVNDLSAVQPKVHLLKRGAYNALGEEVPGGGPGVLSETTNPGIQTAANPNAAAPEAASSTGRRLALARWMTQPDSRAAALLARVTVNRWWQHHFGTGIVATPDNFGYSGTLPTHPELLDYLAGEFINSGWSAKAVHRLIVNSTAYRQSSLPNSTAGKIDPQNKLLWSYPLRRLDAEAIRDSMLAVSGELNHEMYGPYVASQRAGDGDVVVGEGAAGATRRSVYQQQRRTQIVGMLEAFDAPSIVFNCTARTSTTVPLQSLKLLNSDFVRLRATALASRVRAGASKSDTDAIQMAIRLTLARSPTAEELAASEQFLKTQPAEYSGQANAIDLAWIDLCQMLLASNAFLYVE